MSPGPHLWVGTVTYELMPQININLSSFQVGNPQLGTQVSNDLMEKHGIYVQAINYPTVPHGEEKLRIAPTPHHTRQMMDHFVEALMDTWVDNGLALQRLCTSECEFCKKPLKLTAMEAREKLPCDGNHCNEFLQSAQA